MTEGLENSEVFIHGGEAWIPNGEALVKAIGALYINRSEGDLYAGIIGRGEVPVADLLKEMGEPDRPKLTAVRAIK